MKKNYEVMHSWDLYSKTITVDYQQSLEEGRDVEKYKDLVFAVNKMPFDENREKMADIIFDILSNAPMMQDYKYNEPSTLDEIKRLRQKHPIKKVRLGQRALKNKTQGAWFGRICGCILGKPVESLMKEDLWEILKESGNFPLHRYISFDDVPESVLNRVSWLKDWRKSAFIDAVLEKGYVPYDDDTNYMVLAQEHIKRWGRDFIPRHMSNTWLDLQPKHAYCTAERVAYINFVNGIEPPYSASYKNSYREWIGAQIRGDYFGYINPQNPEAAAEMGFKDACISHIKNGIYGEMWACAMIACAYSTNNIEDIIRGGLAQIPKTSRLYEAIDEVICDYNNGLSCDEAYAKFYEKYDDHYSHHWCHTISNAISVAISLRYGGGDFEKSICMAVQAGFDTDCNGATVGSIVGIINGYDGIPQKWLEPLNNTLETTIFGYDKVKITDCVKITLEHTK